MTKWINLTQIIVVVTVSSVRLLGYDDICSAGRNSGHIVVAQLVAGVVWSPHLCTAAIIAAANSTAVFSCAWANHVIAAGFLLKSTWLGSKVIIDQSRTTNCNRLINSEKQRERSFLGSQTIFSRCFRSWWVRYCLINKRFAIQITFIKNSTVTIQLINIYFSIVRFCNQTFC